MKVVSLPSGLNTIISNEEQALIELIQKASGMLKRKMDDRQQQVAVDLVKRQVLTRALEDGKIIYRLPPSDIWRI